MYYYIILILNAKEREDNKSTSELLRYGGFSGERQESKTIGCFWEKILGKSKEIKEE